VTEATKVLDLSAIFTRHKVKIGDRSYELRNRDEFSLIQFDRINKLWARAQEIEEAGDDSDPILNEASQLMKDLATLLVVDLDQEIPDLACVAIFQFWMKNQPKGSTTSDPPKPRDRTTAGSSRGSKRSTAATRSAGSTSQGTR